MPVDDEPRQPTSEVTDEATSRCRPTEADEAAEAADEDAADPRVGQAQAAINWSRVLAFGVLPVLALLLAAGGGFLKWQDASVRERECPHRVPAGGQGHHDQRCCPTSPTPSSRISPRRGIC